MTHSKPWLKRLANALLVLAGCAVLIVAMGNCCLAWVFPLEIEIREGTSWLHVITMEAGISLYDHSRVAFVNMNHGPMDPILKYAVHRILPFLGPAMVTRFFVLILPLGLLVAMSRALRGRWLLAGLCAGSLYLFLLGLTSFHLLVGRSDPAAAFFLALMLAAADFSAQKAGRRLSSSARFFAVGLLGSLALLTNWRFSPYVIACGFAFAVEATWYNAEKARAKLLSLSCLIGALTLGFLLPFFFVLIAVFHGNCPLYFVHFFGFFQSEGGWGTSRDIPYSIFPAELLGPRWPADAFFLIGLAMTLALPARRGQRKLQWMVWLPTILALWFVTAYVFYINHGGGGLYYFTPFYIVFAFHIARSADWNRIESPLACRGLLALMLCGIPWRATWRQVNLLKDNMKPARAFLAETRRLTRGYHIQSENAYFFEKHYGGEVIDMGDLVWKIYPMDYYGDDFDATAQRYFDDLQSRPPRFIMTVGVDGSSIGVVSPVLCALVNRLYVPILTAPNHLWANPGGHETLYQLKKTIPSVRQP